MRRVSSRELETYSGIQRELNRARTAEIAQFVRTVDAAFPNAIIVNVSSARIAELVDENTDVGPATEPLRRNSPVVFEITGDEFLARNRDYGFDPCPSEGRLEGVVNAATDARWRCELIERRIRRVHRYLFVGLFDSNSSKPPQNQDQYSNERCRRRSQCY